MSAALAMMLAAVVLLLAAAGLILRRASARARSGASEDFLVDRLASAQARMAQPGQASAALPPRAARRSESNVWSRLVLQAGIKPTLRFYLALILPLVLVPAVAWLLGGVFSAVAGLLFMVLAIYFYVWYRADKRKRRMIGQLPGFLDTMVRLITIGNSMNAAFQSALTGVDEPLLEPLLRADTLSRSGLELDAALLQVSRQYDVKELFLISSVVALALRFGGRSDQVLERMAAFIRDLEHARDELVASSAEVRLSAWILALLPLGIALFIVMFNNALFMGMWNDPMGFKMLMVAAGLQILGSYWLYRMARAV
jgi:tight adherence protein B